MASVQKPFDLHFLLANPMGLVPVHLCYTHMAVGESNSGHSFELSPPSRTILLTQPRDFANATTNGDGLNTFDDPDNLKVHNPVRFLKVASTAAARLPSIPTAPYLWWKVSISGYQATRNFPFWCTAAVKYGLAEVGDQSS